MCVAIEFIPRLSGHFRLLMKVKEIRHLASSASSRRVHCGGHEPCVAADTRSGAGLNGEGL